MVVPGTPDARVRTARRVGFLVLLVAVPLVIAAGYWYYRVEADEIVAERYQLIHAVGEVTASQIEEWRARLLHDVTGASEAEVMHRAFDDTNTAGRAGDAGRALDALLAFFRHNHEYDAALVVGMDGRVIAADGAERSLEDPVSLQALAGVVKTGTAALSPLFRSSAGHTDIDAVAPVRDGTGATRALLVFRTNASAALDPLLRRWPTPSRSAEALLVAADGDDVLFLTELRHRRGAAMTMREPKDHATLPAARALAGRVGKYQGTDYRNVEVVAELRAVRQSPWYLIAKIDMAEILTDARGRAVSIALNVALLIGLVGAFAAVLSRQAQADVFRNLYEAERRAGESEDRFRATVYSIGDAVITTDTDGRIREMNRVAERLSGWTERDASGRPLDDVFRIVNEDTRESLASPVASVLRDGQVVELANHTVLVGRDGREVPIADSAAPISDDEGRVSGVVLVFSDQTASHAARHRLEESEQRLRLALSAANQGTFDLDVVSGDAEVSSEYATMLGYDPATFRETNAAWVARLHPDDRERVAGVYRAYIAGEVPDYRVEFRQLTADGAWRWILSVGKVVSRTADGRPVRMMGTHTDISALKDAEQRIARLSQLYATLSQCNQAIVRSSGEADLFPQLCRDAVQYGGMAMAWVGIVDPATRQVIPVASYGDDTGYLDGLQISTDAASPFGWGPTGRAIRDGRSSYCADFQADPTMTPWRERAARAGYAASAALPLLREGQVIGALMLYAGVPGFFDAEGQKLLSEMATDISFALDSFQRDVARRRAQDEADAARHQLEATLNAVPDLMFEVDLDGRFHACHTPRNDVLLLAPDAFLGRTVAEVLPPDVVPVVMDAIAEAGRVGHSMGATYSLDLPAGRFWFELSAARKSTPPGERARLVVLAREVTSRHRAEQQRDHLEAQLRQAQKMEAIGQLAGGIAHDFNNLLTIINGRSDLVLAQMQDGHAFHEDIVDIRQAGERAAALTRQLLTFSRREIDVSPAVVHIQQGIAAMQGMLRRLISEDIHLTVSSPPDAGAVRLAAGQLEQVVLNLVLNASDAMPDGGHLDVRACAATLSADEAHALDASLAAGRFVRISVRDTGMGMDAATLARIFDPFFTTKGLGKGTGLGLSTVYGIVRQAGGAVVVASEPGCGATFDVYLPHVEHVARPAESRPAASRGHETVLVVDDERALVTIASRILAASGYTVLTAGNGNEALTVLASSGGAVDLLLTDVVIPGISGRELAERVRQTYPGVRVLFSSGYTDDEVLRKGVESSQAHFLAKPYSVAELTAKVREVLDAPEA